MLIRPQERESLNSILKILKLKSLKNESGPDQALLITHKYIDFK